MSIRIYLRGSHSDKYTLVDTDDLPIAAKYKWYFNNGYASTVQHVTGKNKGDTGRSHNIKLARLIMGNPVGLVDHINGDKLDNRRDNLRIVNYLQNSWNTHYDKHIIGVRKTEDSKYMARVGGVQYGTYDNPKIAALVYDHIVRHTRGNYTNHINYPDERLPDNFIIVNFNKLARVASKKSGIMGITWFKPKQKWRLILSYKHYGYFDTLEQAIIKKGEILNENS